MNLSRARSIGPWIIACVLLLAATPCVAAPVDLVPRPLGAPATPRGALAGESDGSGAGGSFLAHPAIRTGGALAIVLSAIFAAAALVRKTARIRASSDNLAAALGAGGPSPSGLLEILGRYPVSRGVSLVLLRIDRRVLLLSQSHAIGLRGKGHAAFTTLCEVTDAESVASILVKAQDAEQASVSARFSKLLRQHDASHAPVEPSESQFERPQRRVAFAADTTAESSVRAETLDRSELWDDSPQSLPFEPAPYPLPSPPRRAVMQPEPESDPMGALRNRLTQLRGTAGVIGARP